MKNLRCRLPDKRFFHWPVWLLLLGATVTFGAHGEDTNLPHPPPLLPPPAAPASPVRSFGPASLQPDPVRLLVAAGQGESQDRKIVLWAGGGDMTVNWTTGEFTTIDGTHVLPKSCLTIGSNALQSLAISSGVPVVLPVRVSLQDVPCGEYNGNLILYSSNSTSISTTILPLVLRVKAGPVLPALVLLASIIVSLFLAFYRQTGKRHDQVVLRASTLEQMLRNDPDLMDNLVFAGNIRDQLKAIRLYLDAGADAGPLARAETAINTATQAMDNWIQYKAEWLALFTQLEAARAKVGKLDPQAQNPSITLALAAAEEAARLAPTAAGPANLAAALKALVGLLNVPVAALGGSAQLVSPKNQVWFLPGEIWRARFKLRTSVIIAYGIVILILFFAGFSELYLNKSTFGANLFGDYLYLILWGFGAETTSRTAISGMGKTLGVNLDTP
ncbi:MAG TPA: hypothetical protein VGO57_15290 [Verrucomicrobiae bacterium]